MKHDMKTIREALGLVCGSAEFSVRANSEVTEYAQTLSKTLADAIDELEALRAEVAKKDARIAELEYVDRESVWNAVRALGFTTRDQTDEIVDAIASALS